MIQKKPRTEIGVAELHYAENGTPEAANFTPSIHTTDLARIKEELAKVQPQTADEAMTQAQTVLAEWFSHLGDIELADRETGKIEAEMVSCMKWDNGRPKVCTIRFVFALYS